MRTDTNPEAGRNYHFTENLPQAGKNIFPAILDTLEDPLFLFDHNFKMPWHNKACNQLYQSVSGRPIDSSFDFNELLTKEQQPLFKDQLVKVLTGEKAHFEWNYRKSITKWVSVSLYPFIAGNGKCTGICGCMRDITEKKLNEQVLLRNTAVLNSIGEGVVLIDADFNVLTFNRRAYDMISKIDGQPRLGGNFINLLPPHRRIQAMRALHAAFQGEHVEYEELYAPAFWILINCHPVRNDCGAIKHVSISFRNITERKRSEERLKASEKKYRSLVNSLSEGVILQTSDKTTLTVNKNAELILGLTSEELMQNGFPHPGWSIVDKNEKEIPHEEIFGKKNGRIHPVKGKVVGIRKNNHVQWLRLNMTGVNNSRHVEPSALVISFEDITEQKRISGEMKILSMVAKETMNAVLIMLLNGEVLWVNEGFTRLTGYSAEEVVGTTSRQMLFGPDTDMKTVEELRHARENGSQFESVQAIYTKQGAKIWTKCEGQPMKDENGVISRIFVIVTDITAEKKIMEEMEVLSMIAKETGNGVMIFDKTSSLTLWINEGFTRLTGFEPADIIGKNPVAVLQAPETDQDMLNYMTGQIQNNLPYDGELLICVKDGSKRLHHITAQPFKDIKGEVTRYFAITTDITERRQLEEERLQNQIEQQKEITRATLQGQEAERNELGRELHDNINQLLAAVNLQLCYCIDNYKMARPVIRQSRDNVLRAIEEIRSLSHKMVMPRFSATSLQDELNELTASYRHTQDIELKTTEWDEKTVPQCVKETFFRIAQEKLNNIQKHAQAKKITIRIKNDAGSAFMCIKDDGIGFDPTQKKKGIGIANIISRVEAYNGTCKLISAPGMGCKLFVSIPYNQAK